MKKEIPYIVTVVLVVIALIFLMRVDVPCEENPRMVANGYCEDGKK